MARGRGSRKKPERKNIFVFIGEGLAEALAALWEDTREGFGFWYCRHCCRYHGPLVIQFDDSDGATDPVCSLGTNKAGRYVKL